MRTCRGVAALLVTTLLLAGCGRTYYTPEIAGVVTSLGPGASGTTVYTLASGQELTIDVSDGSRLVYGGTPNIGDLLLSGTGPTGPTGGRGTGPNGQWIARLSPAIRGECGTGSFELGGAGTDRGEWVETDTRLRLHKAMGTFDPGDRRTPRDGLRYEGSDPTFCVDADGEVTRFL